VAASPPRPLRETDNRESFDCGRESLNLWFRRHAWHNHASGASRVNVIEDAAQARIVGFVALSATQIERAFLPKARQRNSPDPIPATLLGRLAVDKTAQGQGRAASLLKFAFAAALRASMQVGSFGVITHPLDEGARRFYARWGFEDLPFDPRRAMIVRMVDLREAFGDASQGAD
jgi:GNAT superfamily N-acetyltransferase